ncbi:MAG: GHKL domain-containing protein [Lachnospiraceae bacterium]|nr:GHKL domain-containing protein [Lachnospiraceae bacterium]
MVWRIIEILVFFWGAYLVYSFLLEVRMTNIKKCLLTSLAFAVGVIPVYLIEKSLTGMEAIYNLYQIGGGFIIPVICIYPQKNKWKDIAIWPVIYLEMSLIITFLSFLVAFLLKIDQERVTGGTPFVAMAEGLSILCLLILVLIKKKLFTNSGFGEFSEKMQLTVVFSGVICSYLFIDLVNYIRRTDDYVFNDVIIYFMHFLSLYFFVISLWLWFSHRRNMEYRNEIKKYNDYLKEQERFIHSQIDSDEKIRRLRHDMNANIDAMAALASNDDHEELKKFVLNLKGVNDSARIRRYSGISAVDAVVGGVLDKHDWTADDLKWSGMIYPACKVEIFDLCVIVSNLLSNAMEACDRNRLPRHIEITVTGAGDSISIVVKNPACLPEGVVPSMKSEKEDEKNHGFGIKNVRDVLSKYSGELSYKNENGSIYAIVIV